MALGRTAIMATVAAWVAYAVVWTFSDLFGKGMGAAGTRAESIVYLLVVTLLTASTVAYLLSRLGFFYRARAHHRASRAQLEDFFDAKGAPPSITVLVPSYKEDDHVVLNTVLSAALQEWPLQVVLLVDDPPRPSSEADAELLARIRALPERANELLAPARQRWQASLDNFVRSHEAQGDHDMLARPEVLALAGEYAAAAHWVRGIANQVDQRDHMDRFFLEHVLGKLASDLEAVSSALHEALAARAGLTVKKARQLYRRLAWIADCKVTAFERKRYCSLHLEANKASNLNSYIGLMGGRYVEVATPAGKALVPAEDARPADLEVPDPDYVLTLDADSVLLPEYCLRLVHQMEQEEHARTAVIQTPYSAFPGAATRLERVAGATTDVQHILHQGLTYFRATFWVGANALIRKSALDAVAVTAYSGDWPLKTYISDRTVIEDTESTIAMCQKGWDLYNYPERLSYSATPPDFGSLCVQRRRWATGGLLIAPGVRALARSRRERGERSSRAEAFLRLNYTASVTWSSVGLLVLLAFPFTSALISPLLGVVALPYFWAMASDLRYCGYKWTDVFRLYGFNLLLLPVNLAGSVATVVQAVTASKVPFARTPKVRDRTVVPPLFLVAPYLVVVFAAATTFYSWERHHLVNVAYGALNTLLLGYAIVAFVGLRDSLADASLHLWRFLHKPPRAARRASLSRPSERPVAQPLDWRSVLGLGPGAALADQEAKAAQVVFQPVVRLEGGAVVGYEALGRLAGGAGVASALAQASSLDEALSMEETLARSALRAAAQASLGPDQWVAVKVSARLLRSRPGLLDDAAACTSRVLLEVPEPATHEAILELANLRARLPANTQLAVEQAAGGHWSLKVLETVKPAYVKLDMAVSAGAPDDTEKQARLKELLSAAGHHGCKVVATGVETEQDRDWLARAGVPYGQGYLLGVPRELEGAPEQQWQPLPLARPAGAAPAKARFSFARATSLVLSLSAIGWGTATYAVPQVLAAGTPPAEGWFAPYVDATLTPLYQFQDAQEEPARQVILGFVVAPSSGGCAPSWGGSYSLAQADQQLSMASRVAQLQQEGIGVGVSFGGEAGTELALACSTPTSLEAAYQQTVQHYGVHLVDLDLEGKALTTPGAAVRRAQAVLGLERWAKRQHWPLSVWLTLPVATSGLQASATATLGAFLRYQVTLSGVNVMTMDMGAAPDGMTAQVASALKATASQLRAEFRHWGVLWDAQAVWQHMGATVMIGQNNDAGEIFTVGDARALVAFARRTGLRRISMWSLNRDSQCGSAFSVDVLSNVCSGTAQQPFQFSMTFRQLGGTFAHGTSFTPPRPDLNPANAPYPLWDPSQPYQMGYKVVRDGYIYEAKWYNTGVDPAQQVQFSYQTPWELIGPVLPGDHAPKLPALRPGTYPAWSADKTYSAGTEVLYNGLPYTAKWQNQGASPASAEVDPYSSPWRPDYTIPGEPAPAGAGA